MPNDSHDIAVTTRLGAQNAEAILDIVVSDALDEAGRPGLMISAELIFELSRHLFSHEDQKQLPLARNEA